MAGKNIFVSVLSPDETQIFEKELSWLAIAPSDPTLIGNFEIHGMAENSIDILICKSQSWASPENSLFQNKIKIVADANNTTDINITYRY